MLDYIIPPHIDRFMPAVRSVETYVRRHQIRSVVVGLSGGPDSMLTLLLLTLASRRRPELKLKISAAHVNFNLRGEESLRDENFIKSLQGNFPEVDFLYERFDTKAYAASRGISIEMAARELRHDWWRKLMEERNIQYIATGHNANDNEETLLLNLLRGSSPSGLKGMAVRENGIIRPLLGLYRTQILSMLKEKGVSFVIDSTNLESEFRRNFLRHEILPRLESKWEGVHAALASTLQLQREASAIIESSIGKVIREEEAQNPGKLRWSTIMESPSPITLIYYFGKRYGLTSSKAGEIARHTPQPAEKECLTPGRRWSLPSGAELITTPLYVEMRKPSMRPYLTSFPENLTSERLQGDNLSMEKIKAAGPREVFLPLPLDNYTWRRVRTGDKIRLFPGMRDRKKLVSDVLRENKVPISDRPYIVALAARDDDEIIWIPGIRRSGSHLVKPEAEEVWYVQLPSNHP